MRSRTFQRLPLALILQGRVADRITVQHDEVMESACNRCPSTQTTLGSTAPREPLLSILYQVEYIKVGFGRKSRLPPYMDVCYSRREARNIAWRLIWATLETSLEPGKFSTCVSDCVLLPVLLHTSLYTGACRQNTCLSVSLWAWIQHTVKELLHGTRLEWSAMHIPYSDDVLLVSC